MTDPFLIPGFDVDSLRRAALASRNLMEHARGRCDVEWFGWVPPYLDQLADRLDPEEEQ